MNNNRIKKKEKKHGQQKEQGREIPETSKCMFMYVCVHTDKIERSEKREEGKKKKSCVRTE